MTDRYKGSMSDEEYQFPNDEYIVAEESPSEATYVDQQDETEHATPSRATGSTSRFEFLKNKRVMVTLVVIAVAFFGFKLLTSAKKVQQPVQQAPAQVQPVSEPDAQVEGQLGALKQQALGNQETIQSLRNEVQSLQSSLSTASNANAQLTQSVEQLSSQVQQLNMQIQAIKPKQAVEKKVQPVVPKITYHIVAVLPGRAWIQNNNGKATTVRVGDVLPQYGEVTSINADTGLVLTNSGKTINYGETDD